MHIVIVESPAKAKTINSYLGKHYKVMASFGHVRDLPAKDGSVNPDNDFSMSWAIDPSSAKHLSNITQSLKDAESLILATDPDREGEAISWHVLEVLKQKKILHNKKISRVVFNAITKQSVLKAIENPREIDESLVEAYLARRALDYLVGFTLSPVLWRKLPGARSAGRVQSVALRLICDRESEVERFIRQEYWSLSALLHNKNNEPFEARLTAFDDSPIQKLDINTEEHAATLKSFLEKSNFKVLSVDIKPTKRNPFPPFTTSTLQQAASSRLGFSPNRTMQIAQRLYEGITMNGEEKGLITYMRTDSIHMAPEAVHAARNAIVENFSSKYLPPEPRHYTTKIKNAQEAHEAIRPTDFAYRPADIEKHLNPDQFKLYDMIWKRSIASQMKSADIERTVVEIQASSGTQNAKLRATGSVIRFDGFMAAFEQMDDDSPDDEKNRRLPEIEAGETPTLNNVVALQHFTEPPARYSEAGLIKKMEELGIGRPSTYASILKTLEDRQYVTLEKRKLLPNSRGRIVTAFLCNFFQKYVEYDFTAELEKQLDEVSNGKLFWKNVLSDFWGDFSATVDRTKELRITDVLNTLNDNLAHLLFSSDENTPPSRACQQCHTGTLSLKLGKYGAFIGCSNYPKCNYTRQLEEKEQGENKIAIPSEGIIISPQTPDESGDPIVLRSGRFGSYIERGEGKAAKRAALPKTWDPQNIDYHKAVALLSLPREIGTHPESGLTISAGLGRYGSFVVCNGVYANLSSHEEIFEITLEQALSLLETKKLHTKSSRNQASEIKDFGAHPDGGGSITVREGKYGPYINYGKINVKLDKDVAPNALTRDEALALIAQKITKKSTSKKK